MLRNRESPPETTEPSIIFQPYRRGMRILGRDPSTGSIRIMPETDEDMWHLYNVIETGDLITASTSRREEKAADKLRAEKMEKKRMTLGIRAEKIEFAAEDLRLRALGVIEEGPQDIGQYHTLMFEIGDSLSISKTKWRDTQIERLERAVRDSGKPRIAFVSLDQDDATVAVLRQYGPKEIATIRSGRSGKQYEEKGVKSTYHEEIISKLESIVDAVTPLVLIGPGFEKEALADSLKKSGISKLQKPHVYHTGHSGMVGVNELLKTGMGSDILRESSVGTEMEAVEKLMAEIGRDGLAAYGTAEVENAAKNGAVDTLLILDSKLREQNMDTVVKDVESQKGRILVVSEQHDGGKTLAALGGTAALLRYRT